MTTTELRPPLLRPRRMLLGGVSVALAAHLGWRLGATRLGFVLLALAGGAGVLFYLWLWALVPLENGEVDEDAAVRRRVPVAPLLAAAALLATAVVIAAGVRAHDATVTLGLLAVMLLSGGAVAWSLAFDARDASRSRAYGLWVRGLCAALLLIAGAGALLARPSALNAVLAVGLIVLAIAVLASPRVLSLWTDLMGERANRVREEQRAEIAAHLHDSVLQTLALIQNRAGASSEVARIARAQERELRDWLFERDAPVAEDLAAELRQIAAVIELEHPARIEVVVTGESVAGIPSIVAAAREAMLNAARHAGGEISVYLEISAAAVDVFVRDRGPGVDLDGLGADRLGIRESIIGRMTRAGGTATVRPGSGGVGTEVHLHLEVLP